jgi:tripartite-type tricarboxylate transporter receptor subunit TctC
MPHRRRLLMAAAAGPAAAPRGIAAQQGAAAAAYPSRPVVVVNGYPPGGLTDTATRAIMERLQRELGQPVVVEPKPGAATAVASAYVAQARPDGYTLLMGGTTLAINPSFQPDLAPREPLRELVPIGLAYRSGFVLHVHPSLPVRDAAELIAYCKANPGKVNFGSSGVGAVNHLSLELFRRRARIDVLHVPFRGGAPALIELQTGRIQAMFAAVLEALPALRENRTRPLAVTAPEGIAVLPGVPPLSDTLPGYDTSFWQGLFAPVGTPEAVIAKVSAALHVATADAALRARLAEHGVSVQGSDPAGLRDLLARETAMWGGVIREGNIRPD